MFEKYSGIEEITVLYTLGKLNRSIGAPLALPACYVPLAMEESYRVESV